MNEAKEVFKNLWTWLSWRKVRRAGYWLVFIYVIGFGMTTCTGKYLRSNAITTYMDKISPAKLRDDVNWRRAQWINTCVNNGAAGVLGGAVMGAEAITACKNAGFELFPEQDWQEAAHNNRNEAYENFLWDK